MPGAQGIALVRDNRYDFEQQEVFAHFAVEDAARKQREDGRQRRSKRAPGAARHLQQAQALKDGEDALAAQMQEMRTRLATDVQNGAKHTFALKQRERILSLWHKCFQGTDGIDEVTITALQSEITRLEDALEQATTHGKNLDGKLRQLESASSKAAQQHRQENVALQAAHGKAMTEERRRHEDETTELRDELADVQEAKKTQASKLQHASKKKDADLQKARETYAATLSNLKSSLASVRQDLRLAQNQYNTSEQCRKLGRSRKDELEQELRNLEFIKLQHDSSTELRQRGEARIEELGRENKKLNARLVTVTSHKLIAEGDLQHLRETAAQHATETAKEIEGLKKTNRSLVKEREAARQDGTERQATVEGLQTNNKDLADKSADLLDKSSGLLDKNADLLVELMMLNNNVDDILRKSKASQQAIRDSMSDEIHDVFLGMQQTRDHADQIRAQSDQYIDVAMQRGTLLRLSREQHQETRKELGRTAQSLDEAVRSRDGAYKAIAGLARERDDLHAGLDSLGDECRNMRTSVTAANDLYDDLGRRLLLIQRENGRLEREVNQHKCRRDEAVHARDVAHKAIAGPKEERDSLQVERDGLRGEKDDLQADLDGLSDECQSLRTSIATANHSNDDLQRDFTLVQGENDRFQQELRAHKRKIGDLQIRNATMSSQIRGSSNTVSINHNRIILLQRHNRGLGASLMTSRASLGEARGRIQGLETTVSSNADRIATLEQHSQQLQGDLTATTATLDAATSQVQGYWGALSAKDAQIRLLQHHKHSMKQRHDSYQAAMERQYSHTKQQYEHVKRHSTTSDAHLADTKDELAALKGQLDGHKKAELVKDHRIAAVTQECNEVKQQAKSVDVGNVVPRVGLTAANDGIHGLRSQIAGHRTATKRQKFSHSKDNLAKDDEILNLNNELVGLTSARDAAPSKAGEANTVAEASKAEISSLQQKVETTFRALAQSESKIKGLQEQMEGLQQEVKDAEKETRDYKAKLETAAAGLARSDNRYQYLQWKYEVSETLLEQTQRELAKAQKMLAKGQKQRWF